MAPATTTPSSARGPSAGYLCRPSRRCPTLKKMPLGQIDQAAPPAERSFALGAAAPTLAPNAPRWPMFDAPDRRRAKRPPRPTGPSESAPAQRLADRTGPDSHNKLSLESELFPLAVSLYRIKGRTRETFECANNSQAQGDFGVVRQCFVAFVGAPEPRQARRTRGRRERCANAAIQILHPCSSDVRFQLWLDPVAGNVGQTRVHEALPGRVCAAP